MRLTGRGWYSRASLDEINHRLGRWLSLFDGKDASGTRSVSIRHARVPKDILAPVIHHTVNQRLFAQGQA